LSFQDRDGDIWVADLDPKTGTLVPKDRRGVKVDDGAVTLLVTYQGPEFGVDATGWAVYYTKDVDGDIQVWRGVPEGDGYRIEQVTSGARHQTPVISKDPSAKSTKMVLIRGPWEGGTISWLDLADPKTEHDIIEGTRTLVNAPRWIDDGQVFAFCYRTGPNAGQAAICDTTTGKITVVSNDAGEKFYPWAWYAPEYDGEMLVLALVDYTSLGIWKDNGGEYWDRIATITVPEGSEMKYIRSPETFVAGGKSYISVGLRAGQAAPWGSRRRGAAAGRTDAEVWVFGLDENPKTRFARRCDDGRPGIRRSDPETYIGADEVFVFYTTYSSDGIEIWRAGTGIKP
jgi:hypothetical protein